MSDLIERLGQEGANVDWNNFDPRNTADLLREAAAYIRMVDAAISEAINQLADPCDACDFPSKEEALQATLAAALAALTRGK